MNERGCDKRLIVIFLIVLLILTDATYLAYRFLKARDESYVRFSEDLKIRCKGIDNGIECDLPENQKLTIIKSYEINLTRKDLNNLKESS
jgi:hypothetical protein